MSASETDLARYALRAAEFRILAALLDRTAVSMAVSDKHVRAVCITWANEARESAYRWEREKVGGL